MPAALTVDALGQCLGDLTGTDQGDASAGRMNGEVHFPTSPTRFSMADSAAAALLDSASA